MGVKKDLHKLIDLVVLEARYQVEDLVEQNTAYADFIFSLRAAVINTVGQEYWTKVTGMAYANLEKVHISSNHILVEYQDED